MLLVVDPQIDFITGSLPVPHAQDAMEKLAEYIRDANGRYCCKVVTTDWHPYKHCSFLPQGGQWPIHCVSNTVGAAIYPALIAPLNETKGFLKVFRKGVFEDCEEYSIFSNQVSASQLKELINALEIIRIDMCGLAGDICVLNTLKDGVKLYGKEMFHVLCEYSPSLDSGKALRDFLTQKAISFE